MPLPWNRQANAEQGGGRIPPAAEHATDFGGCSTSMEKVAAQRARLRLTRFGGTNNRDSTPPVLESRDLVSL